MKIFIGIDNSKLTHYVNIIDENGKKLKEVIRACAGTRKINQNTGFV